MSKIDNQLEYFKNNKEDILKQHPNKVLVISPELTITEFESPESGYDYGVATYGYGNFMLKDCRRISISQVHIISPIFTVSE